MTPVFHFFVSLILAFALYPFFGVNSFFVLIGGFLIDLDHYVWGIYLSKNWNPIKIYKFFLKIIKEKSFKEQKKCFLLFHSVEFLIIMIVVSFYSEIALLILIGLLYHYIFDAIFVLFIAKSTFGVYSLVWWLIRYKN